MRSYNTKLLFWISLATQIVSIQQRPPRSYTDQVVPPQYDHAWIRITRKTFNMICHYLPFMPTYWQVLTKTISCVLFLSFKAIPSVNHIIIYNNSPRELIITNQYPSKSHPSIKKNSTVATNDYLQAQEKYHSQNRSTYLKLAPPKMRKIRWLGVWRYFRSYEYLLVRTKFIQTCTQTSL